MNRFNTMLAAAEFAITLCNKWSFAYSNEDVYDRGKLFNIAEIHDTENPVDEDSFYLVSSGGAIGLCEDEENIDWLFLSNSGMDENLPATLPTAPKVNFCPKCGSGVLPGARFCGNCGKGLLQ